MPHGAIIGSTTSGKTFLARQLAGDFMRADFKCKGNKVMALRKPREIWDSSQVSWQTSEPEEFFEEYQKQAWINCKNGTSTAAFLEMSDGSVSKYDTRFRKFFTEGRHDGFLFFYLSQRAATVHPDIRENCVQLYLFTCGFAGAKLWADEFNDEGILQAATLPPHKFIHKPDRYSPAKIRTLTLPAKK